MGEENICSSHIQKLGHTILEIRERALFNVVSKLENGVLFDNDLARSKELVTRLFQWFLFEPCTQEQVVFSLLKRILKSESGQILIKHYGESVLKMEFSKMRSYLEPKYYSQLDELCELINDNEENKVPPFETDVPLSYRTTDSVTNCIGTTATTIEGYIKKLSSVDEEMGIQDWLSQLSTSNNGLEARKMKNIDCLPNCYLKWQPLVEADRHVLHSVENSLKNPSESSDLLSSCEFFTNILLHDFPAEIFLQRPAIVLELYNLIKCGSTRIANAVLSALCDLSRLLRVRIYHSTDVSLQNFKFTLCQSYAVSNSARSSEKSYEYNDISETLETARDVLKLEKDQLSFPQYCFKTLAKVFEYLCSKQDFEDHILKINKNGLNFCLILLEETLYLLCICFQKHVWSSEKNEFLLNMLKEFNDLLVKYGDALEYFRVEFMMSETNLIYRLTYLCLVHNSAVLLQHLIPISEASVILPKNFKIALSNSVLDVVLGKLYPEVNLIILDYVKSFCVNDNIEYIEKYEHVMEICNGMSATVSFLKQHKCLNISDGLEMARKALPSIEFHTNFNFLKFFIDMCSSKFSQISDNYEMVKIEREIVLSLLCHNLKKIKKEMYRLCHRKIITSIGPEVNIDSNGSQILFLLSSEILIDIATFGIPDEDLEVKRYAEDIILYIIKCQIVVSELVWNKVVEALIPSLPIIICHAKKNSVIGKTILLLLDPDTAQENSIPPIVMLKCNIEFLFAKENYLRDEAFSRICWLLTSQDNSRELLPKFNTVYDYTLANACYLKTKVDINKNRLTDHFYQPTSLSQVIDVLKSENLEPVLRRSALNQISVMMEDPLLHQTFLEKNGIQLLTKIMETSLNEQDYREYPDSVIPIISILKNICLHHFRIREELGSDMQVLYFILRGLFLFFTEERMRQDSATLLCLLIFKDFTRGNPSNASFSMPNLICDNLNLPFLCNTHWKVSDYTKESLKGTIMTDRWCLSSVQIQWNMEIFGGFDELIKMDNINYDNIQFEFMDELKISNTDLKALKMSSINYCLTEYLTNIQNATSHNIIDSIEYITMFVNLYKVTKHVQKNIDYRDFLSQPWEQTFMKFLKSLPSCKDDMVLLQKIIRLLTVLVPFYKLSEKECWIILLLKDSSSCFFDLLSTDKACEEYKLISQELLKLITVSVCQEQHYLDNYTPHFPNFKPWTHVIKTIDDNLKFSDAQHFYNLAYLDLLLSSLVHLTASLGWSKLSPDLNETIQNLISGLCELIDAFNCGKGSSGGLSVMGLSITRHALLILNNLAAELQNSKVKLWEKYFIDNRGGSSLNSFLSLCFSRDVIVRAGVLQLLSGLVKSPITAMEMITIKPDKGSILDLAFNILVDNYEANIVRENAANLLANLLAYMTPFSDDKALQLDSSTLKKNYASEILNLIEEYDFYGSLEVILSNLLTINMPDNSWNNTSSKGSCKNSSTSSSGFDQNSGSLIISPGFLKTVGIFLFNLLNLAPDIITNKLQEYGLVKLLFRSLYNPSMTISNTRELALYCDILEMDTVVCSLLTKFATISSTCLGTILHTNDCFNVLISLLNYKNFSTDLPQLIYLRNKLWTEIFDLLSTLIEYTNTCAEDVCDKSVEVLGVLCETIFDLKSEPFLETLYESISCLGSSDLQNSALLSLTSLLKTESYRTFKSLDSDIFKTGSLQHILDSVKTPRSAIISNGTSNKENIDCRKYSNKKVRNKEIINKQNRYKMNLLEEAYFENILPKVDHKAVYDCDSEISFTENNNNLLAGAELCKILLYLYDISTLKNKNILNKNKEIIISALASLLCISTEAKKYAMENQFLNMLMKQLKDKHIQLSLESVDCLRRVTDKRRVCPVLNDMNNLIRLLTNFMINYDVAKIEAATLNLADILHKLWVWFLIQKNYLIDVLQLLNVYTTRCILGCQSMSLTSPIPGSGPRKTPTSDCLLQAIIILVNKEMDQVSKTHDLSVLELSFNIIYNCCESLECRMLIAKSNLFNGLYRLHPGITKKQKPWDSIELMWLEFLQIFTTYPEGQTSVAKTHDVLELIISLANCARPQNKLMAMLVLRNTAFYQPNKLRLLNSDELPESSCADRTPTQAMTAKPQGEFINILQTKLVNGTCEEKNFVVTIIWVLSANNQKAKTIFKSAQLDAKLEDTIKQCQLLKHETSSEVDLNRMSAVLNLLRSTN